MMNERQAACYSSFIIPPSSFLFYPVHPVTVLLWNGLPVRWPERLCTPIPVKYHLHISAGWV
jgi:hypothetical protein